MMVYVTAAPYENPRPVLPPSQLVREVILKILREEKGRTITEIERQDGRTYGGDGRHEDHKNLAVWFVLHDISRRTAEFLRFDLDRTFGSQNISSEFRHMVTNQISILRGKGYITDWRKGLGIFHLAVDSKDIPEIDINSINPTYTKTVPDMSTEGLTVRFISILTRGSKSNTYKFALARALLEYCQENSFATETNMTIPYEYLADKFLNYYWHQECRLRLRQNFDLEKKPHMTQIISAIFGEDAPSDFDILDSNDKERAKRQILKKVFGHARKKTSLVVPRFQKILVGRRTEDIRVFYEYDDDAQLIALRPEAFEFFKKNYVLLSKAVLVEWTKFLEPINKDLPMLATKIENFDPKRKSLTRYHKIFAPYADHCFYCMARLEPGHINVDHLIPWSYIFDDNAWNLVLACQSCNCKKSNSLPHEEFCDELIARNSRHYDDISVLKHSLEMLDRGRGWDIEIQRHYQTCSEYGFGRVLLP